MRIRWLSFIFFIFVCVRVEARDYLQLTAALDTKAQTINGSALFQIDDKGVPLEDLRFRLYPNIHCSDSGRCGIQVDSLKVDGVNLSDQLVLKGTDLHLSLENLGAAPNGCLTEVWFTTQIPNYRPRLGRGGEQYALTGWFPMLAPWRAGRWQKEIYKDFLEPAADLWDISAVITFPDSLDLIAPGTLQESDSSGITTADLSMQESSGLPLFFAKDYKIDSTDVNGVALKIYCQDDNSFMLDTVRAAATATLVYMSAYVMPYPFDELLIVVGGLNEGGGLEQPRMILASSPPRASANSFYSSMIIHEVIHQWFYGIVNSDQAEAPWLDEAVTEYFSLKIGEERTKGAPDLIDVFGMSLRHASMNRMAARPVVDIEPVTRRGDLFYDQTEYYATVYNKGVLVLKTLTGLMGEENEQAFWQEYARTFKYATPQPDDFARIADKYLPVSDSADARTILDLNTAVDFSVVSLRTAPESDSTDEASNWTTEVELVAKHPLGFPVDLRLDFLDGQVVDTVLNPTSGWHRLEFTSQSPAVSATIDPDFKYAVDTDYLNNSLDRQKSRGAALRLFSGVTFLVESLFTSLWGW